MDVIPYGRQSVDRADVDRVEQVLTGDWLTQGPAVAAFEDAVAARCDVPHAVAFSSGTAALHGAAFAAGLGEGDTLLTSALTFAASANCGVYQGADPAFADIDPDTLNMSAQTATTVPARAVVPVDFAGLPAPVDEIRAAVGDDVTLIQDASHSLGAKHADGRPVGCCDHVDMATFSFHPVKPVTSAEGGIVTTRSEELADRLRRFRSHGFEREEPAAHRSGRLVPRAARPRLQLPPERRAQRPRPLAAGAAGRVRRAPQRDRAALSRRAGGRGRRSRPRRPRAACTATTCS